MSVFSRIGEIINANISAMLDKAENPEKMVRLMIHEMEDTLTEIKSSAAEVIAARIRNQRRLKELEKKSDEWEERAALAVNRGRDDLARAALEQKLAVADQAREAEKDLRETEKLTAQYQKDIARLEAQLQQAHRRQNELKARKKRAVTARRVEAGVAKASRAEAFARFERYAERIDQLEAEHEVDKAKDDDLEQEFRELEQAGAVEAALANLKAKKQTKR